MIRYTKLFVVGVAAAVAFITTTYTAEAFATSSCTVQQRYTTTNLRAIQETAEEGSTVQSFLQEKYPLFESLLLSRIPDIYSSLNAGDGFTIFCPSNSVMEAVDEQRKIQISDPRNDEVTEKLASYHVITNGKVTWERLKREDWTKPKSPDGLAALSIGGVLTSGGELRVGRSKSGGFMGWGGKEDGGVVIGNNEAKVVKSTAVANGVVHEVDGFVAPDLIWRYFDQLRIPGF